MDNPEKMSFEIESVESNEIDLNYIIYLKELGLPIKCEDVGGKNIVIPPEAFGIIDSFEIIDVNGETISIDLKDNKSEKPLVIKSDELGE